MEASDISISASDKDQRKQLLADQAGCCTPLFPKMLCCWSKTQAQITCCPWGQVAGTGLHSHCLLLAPPAPNRSRPIPLRSIWHYISSGSHLMPKWLKYLIVILCGYFSAQSVWNDRRQYCRQWSKRKLNIMLHILKWDRRSRLIECTLVSVGKKGGHQNMTGIFMQLSAGSLCPPNRGHRHRHCVEGARWRGPKHVQEGG